MSYILDALRKADAQRERDPARGIHARPLGTLPGLEKPGLKPWQWGAIAAAVVLAAVALWQLVPPSATEVVIVPAASPPAAIVQAPAPAVLPAPVAAPEPVPAPVVAAPAPREDRKAAVAKQAAPPPVAAASTESRIFSAAELPPDLPRLAISGGVYSANPAQRMLIVNGQVVNEGAVLAPDMVLEQIRARSAVLRVRGLRYSVSY